MRVLLLGKDGQLGWELQRALALLGDLRACDRASADFENLNGLRAAVRDASPNIIVNAAAYTAVDKAESEPNRARLINSEAVGVLAEEASRLGALLVHYSTDYVFDGEKRTPYTEDDAPNPLSHYARTKLEGERAIAASGCRHLIIRTSWIYGPRASNFYQVISQKARAGEPIRMVDDQTSVPTPGAFVAEHTVGLLRKQARGLLHVVPSGQATRYEFACAVVRSSGSRSSVEAASTESFPAPARRPRFSVLDNSRAAAALGIRLPRWIDLLP